MHRYLIVLLLASCGIDRTISPLSEEETTELQSFQELPGLHKVIIGEEDEPGEPLIMCLRFTDTSGKRLSAQRVHFYHADTNGEYMPTVVGDETTARLRGEALTDIEGRIFLKTTLPGDYGSSEDNRHIHSTVFGAKPEAYDIHFSQYTGTIGRNFISGSDQHFLANLKRDQDDNLVAFLIIKVKFQ